MPKRKVVRKVVKKKVVRKGGSQRVSLQTQGVQAQNQNLLVIEDSTLKMMIADPRFTAAIPCLASGKTALDDMGKKCGRCSKARSKYLRDTMNQLRRCVSGLSSPQQAKLKKLLGVKKVRVITGGGKRHTTF